MKPDSVLIQKWSESILEDGFTAVPNLLIDHMAEMGINPIELSVILAIERHRYFGDTAWPSNKVIGQLTGYSPRHVNRITNELYERNLLNKVRRPYSSCLYDFKPLIQELERFKRKYPTGIAYV